MIEFKNPWGISPSFDSQRSDLWQMDLSFLVKMVLNPSGVVPNDEYASFAELASAAFASDAVCAVTLPESVIEGIRMIDGTIQRQMPGYNQPLSVVRVELWHESFVDSKQVPTSGIYGLLRCWQMLVTSGQESTFSSPLLLANCRSKPVFKCQLPLTFKMGSDNGETLDNSERYILYDCWISQLQLPDLDADQAAPAVVVATIQVGSVQNSY